jgi:hypothetical protein
MAGKFKAAFGGLLKSVHQLWLEVTGTFLLFFAAGFGFYAVKEYLKFPETTESVWGIVAAAGLCLLTFGFGLHSLWKSRKLR